MPFVATRSFMPTGTPASTPGSSPAAIFLSTAFAAARATSGAGMQNECKCGSSTSMRFNTASVTSTADNSFLRTLAARLTASMRQISLFLVIVTVLLLGEMTGSEVVVADRQQRRCRLCAALGADGAATVESTGVRVRVDRALRVPVETRTILVAARGIGNRCGQRFRVLMPRRCE